MDVIVAAQGNYAYSAGSNSGYVEALFPTGTDTVSNIAVRFYVNWTYNGPPQNVVVAYHGNLTGSAGTGSKATAGVSSNVGSITRNTDTFGNPFNASENCGTESFNSNNIPATVNGSARVDKLTGSSGGATSTVTATI